MNTYLMICYSGQPHQNYLQTPVYLTEAPLIFLGGRKGTKAQSFSLFQGRYAPAKAQSRLDFLDGGDLTSTRISGFTAAGMARRDADFLSFDGQRFEAVYNSDSGYFCEQKYRIEADGCGYLPLGV